MCFSLGLVSFLFIGSSPHLNIFYRLSCERMIYRDFQKYKMLFSCIYSHCTFTASKYFPPFVEHRSTIWLPYLRNVSVVSDSFTEWIPEWDYIWLQQPEFFTKWLAVTFLYLLHRRSVFNTESCHRNFFSSTSQHVYSYAITIILSTVNVTDSPH